MASPCNTYSVEALRAATEAVLVEEAGAAAKVCRAAVDRAVAQGFYTADVLLVDLPLAFRQQPYLCETYLSPMFPGVQIYCSNENNEVDSYNNPVRVSFNWEK